MHGDSGDALRQELLSAVLDELRVIEETNDIAGLGRPEAEERVARLESWLDENAYADLYVGQVLGWLTWYRAHLDPAGAREPRIRRALELLATCYENGVSHLPVPLLPYLADGAEAEAEDALRRLLVVDDPERLAHTVTLWHRIVGDTPQESPDRSTRLSNLAVALHLRVVRAGPDPDLSDLDSAVELFTAAAAARQEQASGARDLADAGQVLLTRYGFTEDRGDLDGAVVKFREAVALSPDSPSCLLQLGRALRGRFAVAADPADLTEALASLRTADRVAPPDDPERGRIHEYLGAALRDLAARTDRMADLDAAVAQFDLALAHVPEGHADRERVGARRAEAVGRRESVHEARDILRLMTESVPPVPGPIPGQDDDDPAITLMGIGGMCRLRGRTDAEPEATHWLDMAIAYYRAALATAEPDHPDRADMLSLLGTALAARGASGSPASPEDGADASGAP
ncbi:hypothetical protein ABTY59_16120 [Streptomyces sp. NPDC096079]|uniref:hypothetical protein n=1 Tax=Streptomyces sp. NPDC096079 TaxID=3155820 RepID=UPI0033342C2A